ncbi:hypothetical protein G7Y89_g2397 [Cudoniella acicularis]|uniref:Uncharacterized protein n=1 Tax=Cudoniella acicularis TaxID=354080 RepID=A0A8H4RTJ0_9HELO|nr:hypothetical protein G7Y89_g2397 [Cudoniella acicularis]
MAVGLTEWVLKYGAAPDKHKSDLTPTAPRIPAQDPDEFYCLELIDNSQRQRLGGFTTRELADLDTLCVRDVTPGNLRNGVIQLLQRDSWGRIPAQPEFKRSDLYPLRGRPGEHWTAHNNEIWEILRPILKIASRILIFSEKSSNSSSRGQVARCLFPNNPDGCSNVYGFTVMNYDEMINRRGPKFKWRAFAFLNTGSFELLRYQKLNISERMIMLAPRSSRNAVVFSKMTDFREPYYQDESIDEIGQVFENAVVDVHRKSPNTHILQDSPPNTFTDTYPVLISVFQDVQQNEFWDIGIRAYGHGLIYGRALKQGNRYGMVPAQGDDNTKYIREGDPIRIFGQHPNLRELQFVNERLNSLRVQNLSMVDPIQRAILGFSFNRETRKFVKAFIAKVRAHINSEFEMDEVHLRLEKCRLALFQPANPAMSLTEDTMETKLLEDVYELVSDPFQIAQPHDRQTVKSVYDVLKQDEGHNWFGKLQDAELALFRLKFIMEGAGDMWTNKTVVWESIIMELKWNGPPPGVAV